MWAYTRHVDEMMAVLAKVEANDRKDAWISYHVLLIEPHHNDLNDGENEIESGSEGSDFEIGDPDDQSDDLRHEESEIDVVVLDELKDVHDAYEQGSESESESESENGNLDHCSIHDGAWCSRRKDVMKRGTGGEEKEKMKRRHSISASGRKRGRLQGFDSRNMAHVI